ncbi:hypothetical protein [Citreimonas sp.]|uniref:hypothetical protein n=1 Tax=Citreimonas sp. TaxID=3036715 RepID=UPI00405901C1
MAQPSSSNPCAHSTVVARFETFEVRAAYGMFYIRQPRALTTETHRIFLDWLNSMGPEACATPTIHDMRGSAFDDVGTEVVKAWVHLSSRNRNRQTTPRAMIVGSEAAYGTMRMFQNLSDARSVIDPSKLFVTYSLADGIRWLRPHRKRGAAALVT